MNAPAISTVKYSHDAMIDMIIAHPGVKQGELAKTYGYTEAWVSRIINSDAFQAKLALRKAELVDPTLVASVEEKLRALASKSLDVVMDKLTMTQSPDLAIKAAELSVKALGYGARQQKAVVQNNFVVALPSKAASADEWLQNCNPNQKVTTTVTIEGELDGDDE